MIKKFENPDKKDFVKCLISPKGAWVYGLTQDGYLLCYDYHTGDLKNKLQVDEVEPSGLAHHPHRNLIATFTQGALIKIWKPSAQNTK